MKSIKQTSWIVISLFLLIGTGWYYSQMNQGLGINKKNMLEQVESTITELSVKQYAEDGSLSNYLTTPLVQHFPNSQLHLLKMPHILIKQEGQPAWEIDSIKAKAFNNGLQITFIENVVVHQNPGDKTQESTLKTEEVTYYPKEKKATTSLFVTFEQPGNIIQSTGMNAYLDEKRVELLHKARGSYVPNQG